MGASNHCHKQNMERPVIRKIVKWDYLMLPILALAFYVAFIPHIAYSYPVHLDEWTHLACAKEIVKEASVANLSDPFTGGAAIANQQVEFGFHLFWAVFYQISGISWLTIFRYFPSIIFMITVLSAYVFGRRLGFGWEAAFFTTLIPTTVGILGPGFMVPVATGLLFIPLSLFVVYNAESWWSYVVLSIFAVFLFLLHAATAVVLVTILIPCVLLNVRHNFKHSLGITLALAVPFLLSLPWTFSPLVLPTVRSLVSPQLLPGFVDIPQVIQTYGYIPILLALLGIFLLAFKGGKTSYSLVFGLVIVLVLLAVMYSLHYGIGMMYYRGLQYMMLMLGIVAGAGLMGVRKVQLPAKLSARLKAPLVTRNIGSVLCLVAVVLTLAVAIPARQNIPYYHMIDSQDYEAFIPLFTLPFENKLGCLSDAGKNSVGSCPILIHEMAEFAFHPAQKDSPCARAFSCFDISKVISYHPGPRQVQAQLAGRLEKQPGPGFPAFAILP
jgi:hypothetical protein